MILSLLEESGANLVVGVWYDNRKFIDLGVFLVLGIARKGFFWLWVLFLLFWNSRMDDNSIVKFMCWCLFVLLHSTILFAVVNPPRYQRFAYRVINTSHLLKEGLMCALQIPLASPK